MKLDEVFDIEPEPKRGELITKSGEVIPSNDGVQQNIDSDYEKTRHNMHNLLEQGNEALQRAIDVAMGSEHPRAFEVVGGLLKQLSDMNQQLLELSEKKLKMSSKKEEKEGGVTNNNAFFVGSTSDLNKLLRAMKQDP